MLIKGRRYCRKHGKNYRWVHSTGLCQRPSPWLTLGTHKPYQGIAKSDLTGCDRVRKLFAVQISYDIIESLSAFSPVNINFQKQFQNTLLFFFSGENCSSFQYHESAPLITTQFFSSLCSHIIRLQNKIIRVYCK